jgi:hypothetical protein
MTTTPVTSDYEDQASGTEASSLAISYLNFTDARAQHHHKPLTMERDASPLNSPWEYGETQSV